MLKLWCLVSGFFQLVLGVFSKLILNIVNKGLKIPKVLSKKSFKFWLHDKNGAIVMVFMLNLFEVDSTVEK